LNISEDEFKNSEPLASFLESSIWGKIANELIPRSRHFFIWGTRCFKGQRKISGIEGIGSGSTACSEIKTGSTKSECLREFSLIKERSIGLFRRRLGRCVKLKFIDTKG